MPEDSNYRSSFGFYKLMPLLGSLGCEGQVVSDATTWFWRQSRAWIAETEAEFDAIAKAELTRRFRPAIQRVIAPVGSPEAERQILRDIVARERARDREVERRNSEVIVKIHEEEKKKAWSPCQHWKPGNELLCEMCLKRLPPGVLARVQRMYETHRAFVLGRLDKEVPGFIGGRNARTYSGFDDIETEVWQTVAGKIDSFQEDHTLAQNGELAWLRKITGFVIQSHFKRIRADKRGVAITFSRRVEDITQDETQSQAVRPPGEAPDHENSKGDMSYVRQETVGRRLVGQE